MTRRMLTSLSILIAIVLFIAAVVPRMAGRSICTKDGEVRATISSLKTAIEMFIVDTGRHPKSQEGLSALVIQPVGLSGWLGPYLKEVPMDAWRRQYIFTIPGKHNLEFDLHSVGKDGLDGTSDDITNWDR